MFCPVSLVVGAGVPHLGGAIFALLSLFLISTLGAVWIRRKKDNLDRDDWWGLSLLVMSGVLIGIFAIPDQDVAFSLKVVFDEVAGFGYFVFSMLYFFPIRRYPGKAAHTKPNPSKGIDFQPRRNVEWLDELFVSLKEGDTVEVLGVDLAVFSIQRYEQVKSLVKTKGVEFTFLLLDPQSHYFQNLSNIVGSIHMESKSGVVSTLGSFCKMKRELGSDGKKMSVRTYDLAPLHSAIVVNGKSENARIQVESYLYKTDPLVRPSLIVSKRESPEVFKTYHDSFHYAFDNSKEHTCES